MPYLVCDKCEGYYELAQGESPEDFSDICECGGNLKYTRKLNNQKICPNCGSITEDNIKICPNCGFKLEESSVTNKEHTSESVMHKYGVNSLYILILIILPFAYFQWLLYSNNPFPKNFYEYFQYFFPTIFLVGYGIIYFIKKQRKVF